MRSIISLSGMIGSGKDTVADHLVQQHGYTRLSFASGVKDTIAAMFGWDRAWLEGVTPSSRQWREQPDEWWSQRLGTDVSPRKAMQFVATEVIRDHVHRSFWVFALERRLMTITGNVVISDTRFFEEFQMLHSVGARFVRVCRGEDSSLFGDIDQYLQARRQMSLSEVNLSSAAEKALIRRKASELTQMHQSEYEHTLWPRYDAVLRNDRTVDDLLVAADNLTQ